MSLINEALKRAQSQKNAPQPATGSPPVGSSPPPPPTPVGTPVPGILTLLLVGGAILAVFTLGAGLIIWGLRSDGGPASEPVRVAAETPPVAPTAPSPSAPIFEEPTPPPPPTPASPERSGVPSQRDSSSSVALPPPTPASAAPSPTPVAAPPTPPVLTSPPPEPVTVTDPRPPAIVPERERAAPEPEPAPSPPPPPQPHPSILRFLSEIEIRGIMAGLQRVLIFNPAENRSSAFETGAVFSRDPFLTIKEIRQRSIIFEDENGLSYEKRF